MHYRTLTRGLSALLIMFTAINSHASLTPVLPNPGGEPSLIGAGGILDSRFGLENLVRIDDTLDQFWVNGGHVEVKALAKWAGFSQSFGYIDTDGDFTSLFNVSNKRSRPKARFKVEDSGELFRFGLDPSGAPLWSSAASDNSDGLDHMTTWQITDNRNKRLIGAYVIAWEDLIGGGDRDYNDLVVLVKGGEVSLQPVPVPAALWLFASGLFGLAAVSRRRR